MQLNRIIQTLQTDWHPTSERGQLIRSAGGSAALHAGSITIAFGASLLYARTLGPNGYGAFATVMAWVTLLTLPAGLGLPQYLLRETSRIPRPVQPLQTWADKQVLGLGLIVASLLVISAFVLVSGPMRWLLIMASPIPLANNLGDIRQSRVQAGQWAARSLVAKRIVAPLATVAILLMIWAFNGSLDPLDLMGATLAAALLPIGINHALLSQVASRTQTGSDQERANNPLRVRHALPFMALGVTDLINKRIDLILVAAYLGSHNAGIFAIATRAAETVPLILVASNTAIASRCARFYHIGEIDKLQRLVTGASRRIVLITTPFALVLMVAGGPLLGLFYGPQFQQGSTALAILVVGQMVAVSAGPNGLLLPMLGSEKAATRFLVSSALVNGVLNTTLIPFFGIIGAAGSTACAAIMLNLLRSIHLGRVYGIRSDVVA